jgi:hypothetical protein
VLYYSLSVSERAARFVSTTCVAKHYGIPQRTVQHWIEYRWILAVKDGRNYKVDLLSFNECLRNFARQMS